MTSPAHQLASMKRLRGTDSMPVAVVIGFATAAAICGACAGAANAAGDQQTARYEVSGSSPVAEYISYQTDTGQQHEANVKLPWSKEFPTFGSEVFVVSAQGPGSLTCTIIVDGKVVNQATANGQPARTVCAK